LQKRGWGTIAIEILEAALSAQKKTRIMYLTNLNYVRTNKYLVDFVRRGFILEVVDSEGKREYVISEEGKIFLLALKNAKDIADVGIY
jgi:predicted transcriptional regulator